MASLSSDPLLSPEFSLPESAGILQELVEVASSATNKQIDVFVTRLADALLGRSAEALADPAEARRCMDAAQLLKKNRYPFYYALSERLAVLLQRETQRLTGSPAVSETELATPPELPPELEIDRKLCLIRGGRAIEAEHTERLNTLGARIGSLLGRDTLILPENPFRPEVFLNAIDETWRCFAPDSAMAALVFRLLGPELCLDLGPILHAQNQLLIRRGVLPVLQPQQGDDAVAGSSGVDTDAPLAIADLPLGEQLRRLFPRQPETPAGRKGDRPLADDLPPLFGDTQLQATVSREQLFAYLSQVQRNGPDRQQATGAEMRSLLAQARQWAPDAALARTDAQTVDLLIPVFEALLGNQAIPVEIRTLLASLQIPVLKATLLDNEFFFQSTHPVRRLLDLLAQLGAGWNRRSGPNDPLYQTVLRNVKRIQSDQRPESFTDALADIEAYCAQQDMAANGALTAGIKQALQREKRMQAEKAARYDVALRIGTGEVAAFVEAFLEDKWVPVLTLAYTVQEEKPQVVKGALKTMDDLCWSVKPKITPEERKELLAKLPGIVTMLNKWLDLINWNDAERARFFDELARCHASIVRAPIDMSPERQVRLALKVAKRAAERRLQWQARQAPEPVPDAFTRMVKRLECGSWLEFAASDKGPANRLRLAWISPARSLFLFATRERQEALELTEDELAQALRNGEARLLLAAGVVAQALEQALEQALAANLPAADNQAA